MDNKLDKTKAIFLTKGVLDWAIAERTSDRYGTVNFGTECARAYNYIGYRGKLFVSVLGTRGISHTGDTFRGIEPSIPEIGDIFELGHGEFFIEELPLKNGVTTCIGLKPDDNRKSDWLDPYTLYKVHNQFVSLWFVSDALV